MIIKPPIKLHSKIKLNQENLKMGLNKLEMRVKIRKSQKQNLALPYMNGNGEKLMGWRMISLMVVETSL